MGSHDMSVTGSASGQSSYEDAPLLENLSAPTPRRASNLEGPLALSKRAAKNIAQPLMNVGHQIASLPRIIKKQILGKPQNKITKPPQNINGGIIKQHPDEEKQASEQFYELASEGSEVLKNQTPEQFHDRVIEWPEVLENQVSVPLGERITTWSEGVDPQEIDQPQIFSSEIDSLEEKKESLEVGNQGISQPQTSVTESFQIIEKHIQFFSGAINSLEEEEEYLKEKLNEIIDKSSSNFKEIYKQIKENQEEREGEVNALKELYRERDRLKLNKKSEEELKQPMGEVAVGRRAMEETRAPTTTER